MDKITISIDTSNAIDIMDWLFSYSADDPLSLSMKALYALASEIKASLPDFQPDHDPDNF
jgi:hypothetical protein